MSIARGAKGQMPPYVGYIHLHSVQGDWLDFSTLSKVDALVCPCLYHNPEPFASLRKPSFSLSYFTATVTPWAACYGELFYAHYQWWWLLDAARYYGPLYEEQLGWRRDYVNILARDIPLNSIPSPLVDHAVWAWSQGPEAWYVAEMAVRGWLADEFP